MQVLIVLNGYSYTLASLVFITSAVFIFRAGFRIAALLMGIGALAKIFIEVMARATFSDEMIDLLDENGNVIGMQLASNIWSNIQYPSDTILVFVLACSVLILSIQIKSRNNTFQS